MSKPPAPPGQETHDGMPTHRQLTLPGLPQPWRLGNPTCSCFVWDAWGEVLDGDAVCSACGVSVAPQYWCRGCGRYSSLVRWPGDLCLKCSSAPAASC